MSRVRPGPLTRSTAAALNAAVSSVGGLMGSGLGAGATRVAGPDGQYLNLSADAAGGGWWFAELTDGGVGSPPAHAWREVVETSPGVWAAGDRAGEGNAYRAMRSGFDSVASYEGELVAMRESGTLSGVFEFWAPSRPAKSISDICLVSDGSGGVAGIAFFEEHADGRARCVVKGFCADCGPDDVPVEPDPCVVISGTVTLQPEDLGVNTPSLHLVGYGPFHGDTAGAYSVESAYAAALVGFTCEVPLAEAPRDTYYSIDGGATWALATDIGVGGLGDGFFLEFPDGCPADPVEVLWELWSSGYGPGEFSISGTVTSSIAVPLSGRVVTLTGANTGAATTDGSGNYTFAGLVGGSTTATVSLTGSDTAQNNLDGGGLTAGAGRTFTVSATHDLDYVITLGAGGGGA